MSIAAFRFSGASTLSPHVYFELVGAAIVGYAAFGEVPTWPTIAGAALSLRQGSSCSARKEHRRTLVLTKRFPP